MAKKLVVPVVMALLFAGGPLVGNSSAGDLEKSFQSELQESKAIAAGAAAKIRAGGVATTERARLKSLAENARASHLLMQERLRHYDERVTALGTKAVERQNGVASAYRIAMDEYLALIDALPAEPTPSRVTLDALSSLLDKIVPRKKRPLLGTLPYKTLGYRHNFCRLL